MLKSLKSFCLAVRTGAPKWSALVTAGCLGSILLAGCQPDTPPLFREAEEVGRSVEGRPIEALTFGTGQDVTLILATIHGNENAGTPIVYRLAEFLKRRDDLLTGRKVVIVPVVNPDGYARNVRGNARGIDLNRNFAASNRENSRRYGATQLSEPESKVIVRLLEEHKPSRIVTMHQPYAVVDWDGPGEPLAEHMARFTSLPKKRVGARPGSLGSYAGEDLKIPIITYELPRDAAGQPEELLWARYGRALLAAVTYPQPPPAEIITAGGEAALAIPLSLAIIASLFLLMWYESRLRERNPAA